MADNIRKSNSIDLPPDRKAAVEAGLAHFQKIVDERDMLSAEIHKLRSEMAALKVVAEAQKSQLNEMESRNASMVAVRDEAVAQRAKYETLFVSVQAMFRAFKIPSAPLVKEIDDESEDGQENDDLNSRGGHHLHG